MIRNRALIFCLWALSGCDPLTAREPHMQDAWVRLAAENRPMSGYASVDNPTDTALRCDAASSVDFGAVEIHRTVIQDGMSRMLMGQVLEIPPRARAKLQPGDFHLMLFDRQRELHAGGHVNIQLQCGAVQLAADFSVRAP